MVQRVKIAGLEAEKTTRLRIQEAELEIEKIKEQHTIDLAKKLKNAKHKIDLLKLDEQLLEARAVEVGSLGLNSGRGGGGVCVIQILEL